MFEDIRLSQDCSSKPNTNLIKGHSVNKNWTSCSQLKSTSAALHFSKPSREYYVCCHIYNGQQI